jgi:hypothetical protein
MYRHQLLVVGAVAVALTASAAGGLHVAAAQTNAPPDATDVTVSTGPGEPVSAQFAATDPDGDALSYTVPLTPERGTVTVDGASFTYTPNSFSGTESFIYQVGDGAATDSATVTVRVNGAPTAAVTASSQSLNTGESVTFDANESSDADGTVVSYEWDVDGDGTFERTGETVVHAFETGGSQAVTVRVTDDDGATDTATATVDVAGENTPPTATDVTAWTPLHESVTGQFVATDPDGDALTYTMAVEPTLGSVTVEGSHFTYTPNGFPGYTPDGFPGTDSFTYQASDDAATDSATATVSVGDTGRIVVDGFEDGSLSAYDDVEAAETTTSVAPTRPNS